MKATLLSIALCIGVSGCANQPGTLNDHIGEVTISRDEISGQWALVHIESTSVTNRRFLVLSFEPSGLMAGNLACNQFSGQWSLTGSLLRFQSEEETALSCSLGRFESQRDSLQTFVREGGDAYFREDRLEIVSKAKTYAFKRLPT